MTPTQRAKAAYNQAKKSIGATNGHAAGGKRAAPRRAALADDQEQHTAANGRLGDADGGEEPSLRPEPWEPIMRLSEGGDAPPFPIGVFPEALALFITEASAAFPCPLDFLAVPMLTLSGAAIGASRSLHIKSTWFEKANLYTTFIASPSSCKSPPLKLISTPFYDRQTTLIEENKEALRGWRSDPDREKKEKPPVKSLFIQNATTEGIAKLLNSNPRGLVKIEDELSAWFSELNAYHAGGKGRDLEFWLAGNNGEPIMVHRANEDAQPIYVRHPCLSITGATTPVKLRDVFCIGDNSTGFVERLLIAYPAGLPMVQEDWREVSEESLFAWEESLANLFHLEPEMDEKGVRPHVVRLSDSGRKSWVKFTKKIADEVNAPDFPSALVAFWGKHKGFAARIALILANLRPRAERRDGENVDGRAIDDAAKVIAYFQAHLKKLLGVLGQDKDTERCRRVLAWIEKEDRVSFKIWELHKDVQSDGLFPTLNEVQGTIAKLVRHNYIRVRHVEAAARRGRPAAEVYECHPSLSSS